MIVVMPNGNVNGDFGKHTDVLLNDLIPWTEQNYPVFIGFPFAGGLFPGHCHGVCRHGDTHSRADPASDGHFHPFAYTQGRPFANPRPN